MTVASAHDSPASTLPHTADGAPPRAPDASDLFLFPASAAQQRLWLAASADASGTAYNITRAVTLHGRLDVAALTAAADAVVARHESLRTVFTRSGGQLQQVVSSAMGASIDVHDLRADELCDRDGRAARLIHEETAHRFDVARGPLFRIAVVLLAPERSVLCLSLHHIICDGWSLAVLYRELALAYTCAASARPIDIGPCPLQYADFAVWQRESGDAPRVEEALAYWRRELADTPPVVPWPADMARPDSPTGRGARASAPVPPEVGARVREIAQRERTTPFVVLISAFAAFLQKWTGARDIPIGTPASGRDHLELEGVVGPFVNTIVPRFRIPEGSSFRAILASGRTLMLDALRHASAPLEDVVAGVARTRVHGVAPVFQTLFALQQTGGECERIGVLRAEPYTLDAMTAKLDFTLLAIESADGMTIAIEFSRDLFRIETIDAALDSFLMLLDSVTRDPDVALADAQWTSDARAAAAFAEGPSAQYPRNRSVYDLFERVAAAHASRPAVEEEGAVVSYRELERRAAAVASCLAANGVRPGDRVAVMVPRSAAFIAAVLGIVRAGAAYVPIDREYPDARVRFMLKDAGVRVALVAEPGSAADGDTIAIDIVTALATPPGRSAAAALSGDAPAYVIYTSGSTGEPKGVVVPHRAIARLVVNPSYVQLGCDDRIALASNTSFDAATFEMWGALLNGATLVNMPGDAAASPAILAGAISRLRISVLFVTTAVFNRVAHDAPDAFGPLRALLFGGEAASPSAVARVATGRRPGRLVHVYGPTECTTFASAYDVRDVDRNVPTIPIGRPISGTRTRVLDDSLRPVPRGVVGELFIGGDGVALGYHARSALTAARFLQDPFAPGERLYRTGDRCRMNADGDIEFVARADRQVKLRGYRIEPAEVERVLCAHAAVVEAAVGIGGTGDSRRLVAAVATARGALVKGDDLRRFAAERLPSYMVPTTIGVTADLPLTANGKIDRARLIEAADAAGEPRTIVTPRDPLETELARIWEELLGVSPIGISDDFFALGGHSLLAASMLDRVEAFVGRRLPISILLRDPTIASLATACWNAELEAETPVTVMRDTGERPPLFFVHGDVNGGGAYCRNLMRALDSSQPFYALAPHGGAHPSPAPSIESMAGRCIALIRSVRPEGPFAIGGYCHGALVAYEVARRLSAERRVAAVLMVHPSRVAPQLRPVASAVRVVSRAIGSSEAERVQRMVRLVDALRLLTRTPVRQLAAWTLRKAARLLHGDPSPRHDEPREDIRPRSRHDPATWTAIMHAVEAYVPRRYDGRVALFLPPGDGDSGRGWRRASESVRIIGVPGDHRTCVTTHIDTLAAAIDHELASASHEIRPA